VARTPQQRSKDGRYAALIGWSGVADRTERLRNLHTENPSGHNWHARRLFGADVDLDALTPTQWAQVEAARLAWMKAMSMRAAKKRRLQRAQRLRETADVIEAEVAGDA